jgi:hypothetical protein
MKILQRLSATLLSFANAFVSSKLSYPAARHRRALERKQRRDLARIKRLHEEASQIADRVVARDRSLMRPAGE